MRRYLYHNMLAFSFSLSLLFTACNKENSEPLSPSGDDGMVAVPFSLSVSKAAPETKMTDAIVQKDNFRGLESLDIIPFKSNDGSVSPDMERWGANLALPQIGISNSFADDANGGSITGLVNTSNAHLYESVYLRTATNSVLAYGKAKDDVIVVLDGDSLSYKKRNGVLRKGADLTRFTKPSEITFSLEPYITNPSNDDVYRKWRNSIVGYLNGILTATISYTRGTTKTTYTFNRKDSYNYHPGLVAALDEFTNEGRMMAGTYEVLEKKLTDLYRTVYYYLDVNNSLDYHNYNFYYVRRLSEKIIAAINKSAYVSISGSGVSATVKLLTKAPECFGLPYGIFALQYREKSGTVGSGAFGESIDTPGGIGVPDYRVFCYPPSLWYFVNSKVVATTNKEVTEYYKSSTGKWGNILEYYTQPFVESDAAAAAIKDPLQYGVARLDIQINKTTTTVLADSKSNSISVVNTNAKRFPLSGVIFTDQRSVNYDFTPISTADNQYIYDSDVSNAYISYSETSRPVSVLALQTVTESNVHFALEFLNNSTSTFFGIDGCVVYPGCHFYLIGVLDYSTATHPEGSNLTSVFTQDYTTEVNINIGSFRNAYTVLPDLRNPELVLGVQAQMEWKMITPGTVIIK